MIREKCRFHPYVLNAAESPITMTTSSQLPKSVCWVCDVLSQTKLLNEISQSNCVRGTTILNMNIQIASDAELAVVGRELHVESR